MAPKGAQGEGPQGKKWANLKNLLLQNQKESVDMGYVNNLYIKNIVCLWQMLVCNLQVIVMNHHMPGDE